ncbi:S-layer homology domain-containing protein [Paenibacillus filicis]|uniref:S-layer homology domain-containing protein n=1 Tax=Paenibacillus gyeongsangnamensis TaxID=3388067 RepID=A0ABT4QIG4_9BACL|nr:S-layer homology domain-containing protein [Paenibacillus filicis]MCZ8516662.1 S-layer homology domain-containing protein [Paenibacillus filicis]
MWHYKKLKKAVLFSVLLAGLNGLQGVFVFADSNGPQISNVSGFQTSIFAQGPASTSSLDDITKLGDNTFVTFQNGVGSDGAASKTGVTASTIVEYDRNGQIVNQWQLTGKCDGLTADPANNRVLATVNEDGNSSMYIIYPNASQSQQVQHITYTGSLVDAKGNLQWGGGTDSIAVQNGNIYLSASAPSDPTHSALVQAVIQGNTANLIPVMAGNATATDAVYGVSVTLGLTDPDSSKVVPDNAPKFAGDIALDSQADSQIVFVHHPGASDQSQQVLKLTNNVQIDDMAWATSAQGTLYVNDSVYNTVYAVTGNFTAGTMFVAVPKTDAGVPGYVGILDTATGNIQPFLSGMGSPKGLLFVPLIQSSDSSDSSSSSSSGSSNSGSPGVTGNNAPSTNSVTVATDANGNVDAKALTDAFSTSSTVTISITGDVASLPASALIGVAQKDGATVIVKSDLGTYILPLSVLKLDDLAKALGVNVAELSIKVTVSKVTGVTAAAMTSAASSTGVKLLSDGVDFNVQAVSKDGKSPNVDFGNTYVSRTLNVNGTLDAANTTGVLYDPSTKTFSFVPSTFETKDGKTTATLKRNGNSIYTVASFNKSFTDIANHWAKVDIQLLANKLVIDGMTDTTFAPQNNITRAQFAALVVRALGLTITSSTNIAFNDVHSSDWYAGVVATAAKAGLINGYEDGSFHPNKEITREELSALVVRALKYAGVKADVSAAQQANLLAKYTDANNIEWAQAEIAAAINAGILNGETDTSIGSNLTATRAESATMLKRFLSKAGFIN